MSGKSVLVDVSKCIGCRGCQVACKQWNKLPAEKTTNVGSYQNPQDLSDKTWTLVRFKEVEVNNMVKWNFLKDQCRHCVEPPCKMTGDEYAAGGIIIDENGAVIYTKKTKDYGENDLQGDCPYNIPRKNNENGLWVKCTFCNDRIKMGKEPACVKACPTGALTFGERDKILAVANERLNKIKSTHPNASIQGADDSRWIYLLHEAEGNFQFGAMFPERKDRYAWKEILSPAAPAVVAAGALSIFFKRREEGLKKKNDSEE